MYWAWKHAGETSSLVYRRLALSAAGARNLLGMYSLFIFTSQPVTTRL